MAIEKEMKLALGGTPQDSLAQWLQRAVAGATPRDVSDRGADGGKDDTRVATSFPLQNIYYDTPTLDLARTRIALRLRLAPRGWLQTLKTAGRSVDGLHARGEWEMPVSGPALDLDALRAACDDPEALAALQSFQDAGVPLIPVFRTDFNRTVWHVRRDGARIEVALDLGKVFVPDSAADAQTAIEELELELQGGDGSDAENEAALIRFADKLRAAFPGLHADDTSKAARGYALFKAQSTTQYASPQSASAAPQTQNASAGQVKGGTA